MVQFVFTPWRNRAELLKVRNQLYPSSSCSKSSAAAPPPPPPPTPHHKWTPAEVQNMRRAIARVFMWVHRGNCPHVVESTAMLMSAVLLDRRHTASSDEDAGAAGTGGDAAIGEYGVRAAYLTAFTRFVTGLLDGHQDRARKLSMYGVAKTVGLPAGFVELRHQGTHEPMPGLAQLRPAAGRALVWIWEYYWRNLPDVDDAGGPPRGPAAAWAATAPVENPGKKRQPVVAVPAAAATSTIKGRMCRAALMGYLQRQEGGVGSDAAKQALTRQLGQWDDVLILRTLEEIGQTARDEGILSRSVKLSREILLRATGGDAQQGEDGGTAYDIEEMRKILREAREEAEGEVSGIEPGKRKREGADDEDGAPGWKRWKGPWTPRPIGIL